MTQCHIHVSVVTDFTCILPLYRCFEVFKVIHQLVDSEEDILMVNWCWCWLCINSMVKCLIEVFFCFFFFKSLIWSGCQICYWGVCCRWGEVLGTAQHSTGRTQNRYMLVDIKMLWSNSKLHYFMMNSAFLAKVCLKEDISRQFLKPSINVSKKEWT